MADNTEIAWCDSTFNHWLPPKTFATLQLPLVANAVRLEVPKLMARMAERHSVIDVICQLGKLAHRLFMMSAKVAALVVSAVPARKSITLENGSSPSDVFGLTPKAQIALELSMPIGVMVFAPCSSLARNSGNPRFGFFGVLLSDPVGWPVLRGNAHLEPRLNTHLGALFHG